MSKECECCHTWWYDSDVKEDLCPNCYDYFKQLKRQLEEKDKQIDIISKEPFYKQGWVCPKCGGVMAPNQPYCLFCQSNNIKDIQVTYTGIMPTISTENKSISKGE